MTDRGRQDAPQRAAPDPRLSFPLRELGPTKRGLRACEQLSVRTVGEFMAHSGDDFLALPNCGQRTYDDLQALVRGFLSNFDGSPGPHPHDKQIAPLDLPLADLVRSPRATKAFRKLGLKTIGELLSTPREELLAVPGFGEGTYRQTLRRVRDLVTRRRTELVLLPSALLEYPLQDLDLGAGLVAALGRHEHRDVGDLLATECALLAREPGIGARGIARIQAALAKLLHLGLGRAPVRPRARATEAPSRGTTVADRLGVILASEGQPMKLMDLLFAYRERHRHANQGHLLDCLSVDRRFLQIGPDLWGLREGFEDQLEALREEASRIAEEINREGRRHNVSELRAGTGTHELEDWLVISLLREQPDLRYLGRGDFVPRSHRTSRIVQGLLQDFRRAMGEVPLSRFLENQPPVRRHLIEHVLEVNRLFVKPAADRVDLLTNYPFTPARMDALLAAVEEHLESCDGYSTVSATVAAVRACDALQGPISNELFVDLLRRHGTFEMPSPDLIAQKSLGLVGWIQQRAREAIRTADANLTVTEILRERPELAEFEECLEELLAQDPLVQSSDGLHFQVV